MRYKPEHKVAARARLLAAAGRAFRRGGYGGVGVDGLAREAGVTSGAFYTHFRSKDEAFAAASLAGLAELQGRIAAVQAEHGAAWVDPFIDLYLGEWRRADLADSCALQSLSADVMRSDPVLRADYEEAMLALITQVADGLDAGWNETRRLGAAASLLALLSGGVTMARSMETEQARWLMVAWLKRGAADLLGTGE
jgi:TetR/AcrR family transcriptional repressor of nem operon